MLNLVLDPASVEFVALSAEKCFDIREILQAKKHELENADGFRVKYMDRRMLEFDLHSAAARLVVKVG